MTTNIYDTPPAAEYGSIPRRITELREMQSSLRSQPVTGSLRGLKKVAYQIVRSTFSRQFKLNAATIDLIEALHRASLAESRELDAQCLPANDQALHENPGEVTENPPPIATGEVVASSGKTQDQAKLNNIRPLDGFQRVYTSPAEMRMPERVVLYSLVFGLQPRHCLEIGTFRGGSTAIICGAMDDTGFGQLACVDPMPKIDPTLWSQIRHRCQMFEGPSPGILPEVARQVGIGFDFCLIDGNHTYDCVGRDIAAVLPLLADKSYLLFHDGHYPDVKRAIDKAVSSSSQLTDCGLLSVEPTILHDNGQTVTWAGLRLLRFARSGAK